MDEQEDIKKDIYVEDEEKKLEYELNQFEFIVFIPNPASGFVTFFIDDGQMESAMFIDQFLKKMETVCGTEEMNKIDVACHDYGVPYFYDRHHKILKEISPAEEPRIRRVTLDKKFINQDMGLIQSVSINQKFDNVRSTINQLSNFGMPDFSPKKRNPFNF